MSFSGKVKEELLEHYARARHCDIAELSAIVHMAGEFKVGHGGVCCLKAVSYTHLTLPTILLV